MYRSPSGKFRNFVAYLDFILHNFYLPKIDFISCGNFNIGRLKDLELDNPYPTAFPYGNGMVLHFYQQQESSTTKTVHKVINKGLKAYV